MASGRLAAGAAPAVLTLYLALTLAASGLPVASAWITKLVIDGLVAKVAAGRLAILAAALVLAGVAVAVVAALTRYLRAELDRRVGLAAQDRLFAAVEEFAGLGRFEDPRFLDRLRLAQQAGAEVPVPNQALDGAVGIVRAAITVSGFGGFLFMLGPAMAALVLASGVPVLVAQVALSRGQARMFWRIGPVERREMFHRQLLSTVEAAKEVRLFGIGSFLRGRMLDDRRGVNGARRALDRRQAVVQVGLGALTALVSGIGLLWAVLAARAGRVSVGDVTVFVAAVAGVQAAVAGLAGDVARTQRALLMFGHYLAVVDAGPDLPVPARPRPLPPLRDGIELRDVWFRYSDEHPWILRGVNLRLPHGSAIALVGLNGTGKSTLIKLLCRFYDPTRGAIFWDGVDLRDVDVRELRRRIGPVFQDYMRYDMTATENIALGDLSAIDDSERLRGVARHAGIHDALDRLPHGYDTLLSRAFFTNPERDDPTIGVVLSGGQWQRLALARAFLRDGCDLMILDEPSSGLDAESEHEIHCSLRQRRGLGATLLISHRLGAVRDADRIVVLSGGRIVEQGDHAALMSQDGHYARLFTLQASGYQPGAQEGRELTLR